MVDRGQEQLKAQLQLSCRSVLEREVSLRFFHSKSKILVLFFYFINCLFYMDCMWSGMYSSHCVSQSWEKKLFYCIIIHLHGLRLKALSRQVAIERCRSQLSGKKKKKSAKLPARGTVSFSAIREKMAFCIWIDAHAWELPSVGLKWWKGLWVNAGYSAWRAAWKRERTDTRDKGKQTGLAGGFTGVQ